MLFRLVPYLAIFLAFRLTAGASNPCDLNHDNVVNAADVQTALQMQRGQLQCTADIVAPNTCNLLVVKRVQVASLYGVCVTGNPLLPALSGLSSAPNVIVSGQTAVGTVTLTGAATSAFSMSLSASNSAVQLPATVQLLQGATSATFPIVASAETGTTTSLITAVFGGIWATATVTVEPAAVVVESLLVSPGLLVSGQSGTGTITLTGPAPTGGALISLSSNSNAVTLPANVTVAQGAVSATFTVTAGNVTVLTPILLTAFYQGANTTFTIGVVPPEVGLTWVPSTSPNVAGYNVYRGSVSGGPYTQLNSSPVPATNYLDSTVAPGATYYYVTTSVDTSNDQSVYSNEARVTIP